MRTNFFAKRDEGMAVVKTVCDRRGIALKLVLSSSHVPALVDARREIAKALRAERWSFPQIGHLLRRDHTTIMALLKEGQEREEMLLTKKIKAIERRAA